MSLRTFLVITLAVNVIAAGAQLAFWLYPPAPAHAHTITWLLVALLGADIIWMQWGIRHIR